MTKIDHIEINTLQTGTAEQKYSDGNTHDRADLPYRLIDCTAYRIVL